MASNYISKYTWDNLTDDTWSDVQDLEWQEDISGYVANYSWEKIDEYSWEIVGTLPWKHNVNTNGYLFGLNNKLYTLVNSQFVEVDGELNAKTFEEYAYTGEIDDKLLLEYDNPIVYYWDDTKYVPVRLTITGVPVEQTVITSRVDLSHDSITGIEFMTTEYEGNPKVAFSTDKEIWKIWSGEVWAVLSEGSTGMELARIVDLNASNWGDLITGANEIFIRFTLPTINDKLINIVVDYTN